MTDQSTYLPASKGLPTSDALSEASPQSMQELFSRNPEYLVERDISDIVLHMRDLRLRLEATASAPRHARPTASKPLRGKKIVLDFDDVDFSQAFE